MSEKPAKPGSSDQRLEARVRSYLRGQVVFNNRSGVLDCVVRNISSRGAKLAISGAVVLPPEFELHIPNRDMVRRVRVTWRREDELGVAFLGEPLPRAEEQRLQALEAENARLRAIVRDKASRED